MRRKESQKREGLDGGGVRTVGTGGEHSCFSWGGDKILNLRRN